MYSLEAQYICLPPPPLWGGVGGGGTRNHRGELDFPSPALGATFPPPMGQGN